ncbi:hypothetical protein [Curtobacterium sp. ME26]|uniref:hypothetical protein n=1 Tax=Curtobacterium sp. ME26 TaxID=2744254 RepID=UPI0015F70FCA|nr:hypothetical protein [Curtobacterium sp. ME26]
MAETSYERDRDVPPVRIDTFKNMQRRFRRGDQSTPQESSLIDLHSVWDDLYG